MILDCGWVRAGRLLGAGDGCSSDLLSSGICYMTMHAARLRDRLRRPARAHWPSAVSSGSVSASGASTAAVLPRQCPQ
eukprot:scaffold7963_cov116-Isochrysis_galbana.AAC.2